MLTLENEYFIRLLLLIFKGGTSVQKKVFMKRLQDDRLQLSDFLRLKRPEIDKLKKDKVLTLKQYTILFPSNGTPSDLNNYDISLLSCLLLNIFSRTLTPRQKKAIKDIRTLRNEFLAHHPNDSIDVRTYFRKWNQLHQSIDNLGQDLSNEDSQELEDLIRCVGEDPIDIKQAIQDIKVATGNSDLLLEHVSTQLENLFRLVQMIYRRQDEELLRPGMPYEIVGEVIVSSPNPLAARRAAEILRKDADSIVNDSRKRKRVGNSNSFSDLTPNAATTTMSVETESLSKTSMAALFQDITDTGGDVDRVTEGSVLLHIQCNSVFVVLNVLNYFKSSQIEQRLNSIAKYLSDKVESCIQLSANIQEESLSEELRFLQQEENREYSKKVRFSIKYQTANGVLNAIKLMEGEEWKNDITAVSKYLSDEVGCPVTLSASLDKVPLQQYIVEAGEHDNDKERVEKGEKPFWADAGLKKREKETEKFTAAFKRPKELAEKPFWADAGLKKREKEMERSEAAYRRTKELAAEEEEENIELMRTIQPDPQVASFIKEKTIRQSAKNIQTMQCERRIILVGKTGYGKSSTANSILQRDAFIQKGSQNAVTQTCLVKRNTTSFKGMKYEALETPAYALSETCLMESGINCVNAMKYFVVDTPGLFDKGKSMSERALEIQRSVDICPEPHAFLIVLSANNHMTADEHFTIDMLRIMFGECIFKHSIVVITHGKKIKSDLDFQSFCKQNEVLDKLILLCKNRVVRMENTSDFLSENEGTQRIFEMIESMSDAGKTVYRYKGLKTHRTVIEKHSKIYHRKGDINEEVSEMVTEIREKIGNEYMWTTVLIVGVGAIAFAGSAGAVGAVAASGLGPAIWHGAVAVGSAVLGAAFGVIF